MADLSPEQQAKLQSLGIDPTAYVYDPGTGEAVLRSEYKPPGMLPAAALEVARSIAPAIGARLAGGAGMMLGGGPASPTGIAGAIGGGLVGGGLTAYAQDKLLENVLPEGAQQYMTRAREEHPYAAAIGRFTGSIPAFGGPSISALREIGSKSIPKALGLYGANTAVQGGIDAAVAHGTGELYDLSPDELKARGLEALLGGLQLQAPRSFLGRNFPDSAIPPASLAPATPPPLPGAAQGGNMFARSGGRSAQTAASTKPAQPTLPLPDEDIAAILATGEYHLPFATDSSKAIEKGLKEGVIKTKEDLLSVMMAEKPDERVNALYTEQLRVKATDPRTAEQSARALQESRLDEYRKKHPEMFKRIDDLTKLSEKEEKLLDDPDIMPSKKMQLRHALDMRAQEIATLKNQIADDLIGLQSPMSKTGLELEPARTLPTSENIAGRPLRDVHFFPETGVPFRYGQRVPRPIPESPIIDVGHGRPIIEMGYPAIRGLLPESTGGGPPFGDRPTIEELRSAIAPVLPEAPPISAQEQHFRQLEALSPEQILRRARGEGEPLPPELEQALQDYLRTAEGEQRSPFASGSGEDPAVKGFGLGGVRELLKNLKKPFGVQVTKSGEIPTAGFVQRLSQQLPKGEFEIYKNAGLESFLKERGNAVDPGELAEWMKNVGPQVEVKPLYAETARRTPDMLRAARIQHEIESWPRGTRERINEILDPIFGADDPRKELSRFIGNPEQIEDIIWWAREAPNLREQEREMSKTESATARYEMVNPKPLDEMPGAVDILVRVPQNERLSKDESGYERDRYFEGDHFGDEDVNILGWTRGYFETLPNGEKVFHVFEVQSDWGQSYHKSMREQDAHEERTGFKGVRPQGHPLLADYNRLALKAAVKHAIDNGATKIALSDAETAMLTERHDQYANPILRTLYGTEEQVRREFNELVNQPSNRRLAEEDGEFYIERQPVLGEDAWVIRQRKSIISQEKGMRLNYDQTLPKILKELTGDEGQRVGFGRHKNTFNEQIGLETLNQARAAGRESLFIRDNLIFKNPDGSPKVDITARMYDLAKVKENFSYGQDFTLFGKDRAYGFGLPKEFFTNLKKKYGVNLDPNSWLYVAERGLSSRLAHRDPVGAVLNDKFNALYTDQRQLQNQALEFLAPYKQQLQDPRLAEWASKSLTAGVEDFSSLPPELQPAAQAARQFMTRAHEIQNERGIGVSAFDDKGNRIVRAAIDNPGYWPFTISEKVYDAFTTDPVKAQRFREDWKENWKRYRGETPGWERQAQEALDDILRPLGERRDASQPLFSAVRIQQGVPLPESWRTENLGASLDRYIDKWSKDMAWGEVMQKDPLARRAFGIKEDPMGRPTYHTDPQTFADLPPEYWQLAQREGNRVGAAWTKELTPESAILNPIVDSDALDSMVRSYKQQSIRASSKFNKAVDSANALASSMLMQTTTAIRDLGTNLGGLFEYSELKDLPQVASSLMKAIADPMGTVAKGKREGALPTDPIAVEAGQVVYNSIFKVAKGLRHATGRQFADEFGKALVHNVMRDIITFQQQKGLPSPLVEEFGPIDRSITPERLAEMTASNIANRVAPDYTFRNLNEVFIPQNRNVLGYFFSLTRWPLARHAKWYEDVWRPALQGKPERLIKSLMAGAGISYGVSELIEYIKGKKPQHLTWEEWMNLPGDMKAEEFAPTLFGYLQMQGTLGAMGDAAYVASRKLTGKPYTNPEISPQMSLAAIMKRIFDVSASYDEKLNQVGFDPRDLADLGLELARLNQLVKDIEGRVRPEIESSARDRQIFEQLYDLSAKTGEPIMPETSTRAFDYEPFSVGGRYNRAFTPEQIRRALPDVALRTAKTGRAPNVQGQLQSLPYYAELASRRGMEEARRQFLRDLEREQIQELKRALVAPVAR